MSNIRTEASPISKGIIPTKLRKIGGLRKIEFQEHLPGVYFLCREYEVVYIGQSLHPRQRIFQHVYEGEKVFDSVFIRHCKPEELDLIESMFIQGMLPEYNYTMVNGHKISPILATEMQQIAKALGITQTAKAAKTSPIQTTAPKVQLLQSNNRLMRLPEVMAMVGLKKSTIYLLMKEKAFPAALKAGHRAVCWSIQDINCWMQSRTSSRETA